MSNKSQESKQQYDLDDKTKAAVAKLWEERTKGRFQNDREGFTKALLELQETATYDESRKLAATSLFNSSYDTNTETIYKEVLEERDLMAHELSE
mgnify:CR=1 FL=1